MVVYERRMPASAREHETSAGLASADSSTGVESSGTLRTTGKALIHPQRHNLKNRFELLRTLGEGTYGKVKLAFEKSSGEHVAIKYVKKTRIRDETDLNRIRREIKILSSLRHEHIVNIRQVFEKKDRIVLVMDCAQGGELYDYLNTKRTLDESETRRIFRQIASAVNYFHQNSIVHRDLKLENIILDSNGNVKIADFGLANYFSHDQVLHTFCGSPLYASPEIVNGKPYHGPEVDVWSLGVVLYTMAYGSMPFESSNLRVLRQQISNGDYAEPAQPCGAAGLIRHMLTVSPARRATMRDVLNHWWINLGHERTPDGRPYDPLPDQPVQQSLSSFSSDFGQGSRSPPPGLHRVPGSRCARKWAETSFDEDEVLHDIRGTTASTSFRGEVALASFKNNNNVNNNINTNPAADDSRRRSSSSNWSEVISHGIKEITHRVNQSLAADVTLNKQPSIDETSVFSGDNFVISSKPEVCVLDRGDVFESEKVVSDSEKPPTIFNSDRKPRRSILKRKGKFSGGDSGCCFMSDDACPKNEEDEPHSAKTLSSDMSSGSDSVFSSPDFAFPSTGTVAESTAANLSSPVADCYVSCPVPATSLPPLCPIHGNQTPLNPTSTAYITFNVQPAVQHTSGSAEQVVPYSDRDNSAIENSAVKTDSVLDTPSTASCTCTFDGPVDLSKVVRRNRKGILRNVGGGGSGVNGGARNSLIEDARKRLSIGSMGSNSSADILDLSYDSGDGEQFTTNAHFLSSAYGSRNRNSLNLESQTLDLQPGDRNSFSLEGEFTALNLEEIQEHNPRQMFYEGNMFDREEAKHVYQQAINICSGHY